MTWIPESESHSKKGEDFCLFKKNWDSLHARLNSHYKLQEKEAQKDFKNPGNLFRKNLQLKANCLPILDLKPLRSKENIL